MVTDCLHSDFQSEVILRLNELNPILISTSLYICMSESEKIAQEKSSWYFQEISQINLETDIYSCTVKVCRHRLCVLLLFQIFITKVLETILVPQLAVSKNQIYFILILVPRITFSLINYVFLPILRQLDLPDFYALFHQYICSICNLIHYVMQLFYFCFLFLCNSGNVGEEHTKKKDKTLVKVCTCNV